MTNKDLWDSYKYYTESLSSALRTLGFAAGGACWLFKNTDNTFPRPILSALLFVALYFLCDVLQYLLGALVTRCWTRHAEKERYRETHSIEGDYDKPAWLDCPAFMFWLLKLIALGVGYGFLAWHILSLGGLRVC